MANRWKYMNWTQPELGEAIKALEEAQSLGAASVSYAGGGTVSYVTYANMEAVLSDMYHAYNRKSGIDSYDGLRFINTITRSGY